MAHALQHSELSMQDPVVIRRLMDFGEMRSSSRHRRGSSFLGCSRWRRTVTASSLTPLGLVEFLDSKLFVR